MTDLGLNQKRTISTPLTIYHEKKTRRIIIILLLAMFILAIFILLLTQNVLSGEDNSELEDKLSDTIEKQVDNLDLGMFDEFLNSLDDEQYQLFGNMSFQEKVQAILNGNFENEQTMFINFAFKQVFKMFLNFIPTLASIVIVAILCGMLTQMRPSFVSKSMGEIIYFVCYGVIIIIVINALMQLVTSCQNTISSMKAQMDAIFPILLTLMAALGGTVSVKVYQPAVAVLSNVVINIINFVIFPIFIVSAVLTVVGNLSDNIKISKLNAFFVSLSKWILGIVFTLFIAFLSIQGITAATHDGISIRMAKYAISSSVPIIGGYIKDGFDLIMASTMLIKNAIGVAGLMLMLSTVLLPILSVVTFMFGIKLTAAVIEPVADSRMSGFLYQISKNIVMLVVAIIGVTFMYFITMMLLMTTSNAFI